MTMTPRQVDLARHALGLPNAKRKSYRNHFVAGVGHDDYVDWKAMVAAGLARRRGGNQLTGGDACFTLTRAGAEAALLPRERLDAEDFPVAIDRPIIFSAPMVRALIDGRKTMTRRLAWTGGPKAARDGTITIRGSFAPRPSPWQRVKRGDRLWVRETWAPVQYDAHADPRFGYPGAKTPAFAADWNGMPGDRWRPSIHMPREISRLTLVVTAARVERLQDISHDDAVAEGFYRIEPCAEYPYGNAWGRAGFAAFWDRLHGAGAWDANPEVVAITFAVHPCNIDQMPA